MRLSYVILAAAVALAGLLDATSAATAVTIAKPSDANAVAFDPRSVGNNHRSLRLRKADPEDEEDDPDDLDLDDSDDLDGDDDQEERGFSLGGIGNAFNKLSNSLADKTALAAIAAKFVGKEVDEMGDVISTLSRTELIMLFDKGETQLQKILPGFKTGMNFDSFDKLISRMPYDRQAVMTSAYTKYLDFKGLKSRTWDETLISRSIQFGRTHFLTKLLRNFLMLFISGLPHPWSFTPVDLIIHRWLVKAHSMVVSTASSELESVADGFHSHHVLRPIVDRRNSRCPRKVAHCKVQRGDSRSLRSRTSRPSKL